MARYDYECIVCGAPHNDVTISNWRDATSTHREFCECGGEMRRLPAAPNFVVGGYNAKNSYGVKREQS